MVSYSVFAAAATDHADGDNISSSLVKMKVDLKRLRICRYPNITSVCAGCACCSRWAQESDDGSGVEDNEEHCCC